MAKFEDHIGQFCSNLRFLEQINQKVSNYYDWQVTVCFYTALHLINAHLAKHDLQYRKHTDVSYALNPEVPVSLTKLPVDEYVAYTGLQQLSRRSRYLVNEKDANLKSETAFITYERHFAKALRHLDKLILYFKGRYSLDIPSPAIYCQEVKESEFQFLSKA